MRAEAGIRIKELNAWLDANGLALPQMGGYDHQTVAGVISTSTHGSGIEFGPLNDFVRSLDSSSAGGGVLRIERAGGPTDRAAYEAHHGAAHARPGRRDVFDAVASGWAAWASSARACSRSSQRFCLREVRELHPWAKVKRRPQAGGVLGDNEHYELVFSPYAGRARAPCLVTTPQPTCPEPARPAVGQAHAQLARRARGASCRSPRGC